VFQVELYDCLKLVAEENPGITKEYPGSGIMGEK